MKRWAKFSRVAACLGLVAISHGASVLAATPVTTAVVDADELAVWRLHATTPAQARAVQISLHDAVVGGSWENNDLLLQLGSEQHARLRTKGFELVAQPQFWPQFHQAQADRRLQLSSASKTSASKANPAAGGIPGYSCYATVEETLARMQKLASTYPNWVELIDIGDSFEKTNGGADRDLWLLKLGKKDGSEKPKLFIHAAMHAREYATAELALRFAEYMAGNVDVLADPSWLLEQREVHILVQMNPDGRKRAETGLYWRKNTNSRYCAVTSNSRGADLNRNFTYTWNLVPGDGGSSSNQCSETYRGNAPASEPETKAVEAYVRSLFADRRGPLLTDSAATDTAGLHIDLHSYGNLVLWPWGQSDTPAPNSNALRTLGRRFAAFNDYWPQQAIGLYPTDGTSDDVSYGELGVPSYTFEIGTEFFQDCAYFEKTLLTPNLEALVYAAKVSAAPYLMPAGPSVTLREVSSDSSNYQIRLSASDKAFGERNGSEAVQAINAVELTLDAMPGSVGASTLSYSVDDGALDSAEEALTASIPLSSVGDGVHRLYFRARDSSGQWGPVSATFLSAQPPITTQRSVGGGSGAGSWPWFSVLLLSVVGAGRRLRRIR